MEKNCKYCKFWQVYNPKDPELMNLPTDQKSGYCSHPDIDNQVYCEVKHKDIPTIDEAQSVDFRLVTSRYFGCNMFAVAPDLTEYHRG